MSLRRSSADMLQQDSSQRPFSKDTSPGSDFFSTPGFDKFKFNRSIRGLNTPTGENVQFFAGESEKVVTTDQLLSTDCQDCRDTHHPPFPQETPFLNRLAYPFHKPSSLTAVPSPVNSNVENSNLSLSFPNYIVPEGNSNLFNVSQQSVDVPSSSLPGLDFDLTSPMFGPDFYANNMTSTPYQPKYPREKNATEEMEPQQASKVPPKITDKAIFHAKDESPKFPPPLLEHSHPSSFGQMLLYFMTNSGGDALNPTVNDSASAAYPSSELELKSVLSSSTVSTILHSSPTKAIDPEVEINDDSSSGQVVYFGGPSEQDKFSTHAKTYYTPQTVISATPPKGGRQHNRKTSKEEDLIISLQTQLALRTELCSQYEADLKARDELVEITGKTLSDAEKEDGKRKNVLRLWRKERACRHLEEAVEDSRKESTEWTVIDESSGEALRMLHRQIARLEREKLDWLWKEQGLQEAVETLEAQVREQNEDIMNLKESLRTGDDSSQSDREFKEGIQDSSEMMGTISVGVFDEEELKQLLAEKDQKTSEEMQRFRIVEFGLRQELKEAKMKYEGLEVQNVCLEEQLQEVNQQLSTRNDEYATLKTELEAQWTHIETAGNKIQTLEKGWSS